MNDFNPELVTLVETVRAEYDGLLTYDMHYDAVQQEWFAPGSDRLWEDLDLDVVGVSAWFPLVEQPPSAVMSVESLRQACERIFEDHIYPLASRNTGRPIVFLEYGATDTVEAPANPSNYPAAPEYVFSDLNGNEIDDGEETQANIIQAFFETVDDHAGLVRGAFFWGNWIADSEEWLAQLEYRTYSFRGKLAENVVREQYACWKNAGSSGNRVGR